MNSNIWLLTFADAISIATTLILASLGAILTERSGVINLGVEGMLLMGAVTGFLVADSSGNLWLALFVAVLVGVVLSSVHAALTVGLRANQIVSGLAMVIFATGLSQFIGKPIEGDSLPVLIRPIDFGALSDIPLFGPVVFGHDQLAILCFAHHCPSFTADVHAGQIIPHAMG